MEPSNKVIDLDFAIIINEEEVAQFGQLQAVLVLIKLPADQANESLFSQDRLYEDGLSFFIIDYDKEKGRLVWRSELNQRVQINLAKTNVLDLIDPERVSDVDWFFTANSSDGGGVLSRGALLISKKELLS